MDPNMTKEELENIESNIDTIYEELIRQVNVQENAFNRYNRTLEVMMGFIGIIITYMVAQKDFLQTINFENVIVSALFCLSLLLVVISGILSFLAYRQRYFCIGPEVKEFFEKYVKKASYNFKLALFHEVYLNNRKNQKIIGEKAKLTKWGYVILGIGFLFILITKTIYYLSII
ncbi:MAG: hypothetical protein CVT89_06320 [Candidatus Altiarchaeales archaeon HGW-Altiarchaeales-2]|nr:MAG: hypothetical protein CVT89_06320 [Candidatus Altiarchaeales archaeon HGW-Altiarchaeales-2]